MKTKFKTGKTQKNAVTHFTKEFGPNEFLFAEGDLGTEMFIIQEGKVEVFKTIDGVENQLAVLDKGDFFGEMSILEDMPRNASARAVEKTRVLRIDGATFDQMLRSNPEIAVRMMRKLSRRLRRTDQLLEENFGRVAAIEPSSDAPEDLPKAPQRVVHLDTGTEFHLSIGSETTIGRADPVTGICPDVDLTDVDVDRSTSRRHAKIVRRGDKFFLVEEIGTTNGTFVNGRRVETGVPSEMVPGDEVQFGLVKMDFRAD